MLGHAQASTLIGSWNHRAGATAQWLRLLDQEAPATSAGAHRPEIRRSSTLFPGTFFLMMNLPILSVPPKLSFDRPVKNSTHIAWAWDPTQGPRRFDHERSEEGPWQADGATGLNEHHFVATPSVFRKQRSTLV